ncbi:ABC transporter ATP-binding protein [Anaerolineales bacterium]
MSAEFTVAASTRSDFRNSFRYILSHVKRHWVFALALAIGAFSNAALASFVPYLIGEAFNALSELTDATMHVILMVAMGIILSQAARAFLQLMRNFSAEVFAQRIERDVRDELYANLLGKSMSFHDMQPVGEIMARVTNDVREMNFMMNPGFNLLVGSSMFLIMPVIASPLIYGPLILVPLGFVIIHIGIQFRFVRSLHPLAQEVRSSFGKMNAQLAEALDGVEVVKGAAQEENELSSFTHLVDKTRDNYIAQGSFEARYLSFFVLGLAFVFAMLHATILYDQGLINIGQVVAYVGQISLFGFPVFSSLYSMSRLASGYASSGRILDVINAHSDLDQNEAGYSAKLKGKIEFRNVYFGYVPDKNILNDVSFIIHPGQTIAIVGQTGAGKTTITKLINRIYDVTAGSILVDDVDVRDWDMESLRSQISVIEQDIFLFSRSIADNISFGQVDATRESVIHAAISAQAHDFIESFPESYDTIIGQRGVTLSGGQRQRLAIARAFQSDPPILILDDSTSAIDSATEDKIQQAIWDAAKNRTTILITHRLSQIRWADHIIVLKSGTVVAQGTHDQLLESSSIYQRIFARYDDPVSDETDTTITEGEN